MMSSLPCFMCNIKRKLVGVVGYHIEYVWMETTYICIVLLHCIRLSYTPLVVIGQQTKHNLIGCVLPWQNHNIGETMPSNLPQ